MPRNGETSHRMCALRTCSTHRMAVMMLKSESQKKNTLLSYCLTSSPFSECSPCSFYRDRNRAKTFLLYWARVFLEMCLCLEGDRQSDTWMCTASSCRNPSLREITPRTERDPWLLGTGSRDRGVGCSQLDREGEALLCKIYIFALTFFFHFGKSFLLISQRVSACEAIHLVTFTSIKFNQKFENCHRITLTWLKNALRSPALSSASELCWWNCKSTCTQQN